MKIIVESPSKLPAEFVVGNLYQSHTMELYLACHISGNGVIVNMGTGVAVFSKPEVLRHLVDVTDKYTLVSNKYVKS